MRAGTNEWQRVDNTGCFPWVLRALLLSWAIVLPYAVITGSKVWFGWSSACVLAGVWLTLRLRAQRGFAIPEMTVDVSPSDLFPDEPFVVTLNVAGDKARSIRWWRAEMIAEVREDVKTIVNAEFAVDPEAEASPVAELQMILVVPSATVIRETDASAWWVQVTVETERGRMESGRVAVQMAL